MNVDIRPATDLDVPAMAQCRLRDTSVHPPDPRMAAYFRGEHHPQKALPPRIGYIATIDHSITGYIAGHLTTRHRCDGEVEYLFVDHECRRQGIATALLRELATWFE